MITLNPETATRRLAALELATPAGMLSVLVSPEDGVVRAAGFGPVTQLTARLAPGLAARGTAPAAARGPVAEAVAAYADGDLTTLDTVAVAQPGGPFLQRAWGALRSVPAGRTITYAQLATSTGQPAAVRAAGSACARNLAAPFIPCHRVVRSDGSLGGYLYGLPVKERLLAHERR